MPQLDVRTQTMLAVPIVFLILFIPGLVLAAIGTVTLHGILGRLDTQTYWRLHSWLEIFVKLIIPHAVPMILVGFLAMLIGFAIKPLKGANAAIVAGITIAAYIGIQSGLFLGGDMGPRMLEAISGTVGAGGGLFAGQWLVRRRQARLAAA